MRAFWPPCAPEAALRLLRRHRAGASAGPGLLTHVLVAKFADHLPLYWQSVIYAREGVDLDRAMLASWVSAASALLRPLVHAIRKHVLAAARLHADDTPVPVLAPGNGKTKTARLWTYVRDDRPAGDLSPLAVWFAYSPDRKGIHPQTHLAKFEGVLQADAYAGYVAAKFMLSLARPIGSVQRRPEKERTLVKHE